jgi:quinol monooxygenase YgiN
MDGQLEMVIYRLKGNVHRDQFLKISARATEWLRDRTGYLSRELLEDDSGQWVDLVRWATMDDALAAAAAFMAVPEAAAFMDAVEPESITMLHPRRVVIDELPQPRS